MSAGAATLWTDHYGGHYYTHLLSWNTKRWNFFESDMLMMLHSRPSHVFVARCTIIHEGEACEPLLRSQYRQCSIKTYVFDK